MFQKTYANLYAWLHAKYESVKGVSTSNNQDYGRRLIQYSGMLAVILILSPLPYDGVMNIGVAGLLFLGENFVEKHFEISKSWRWAYNSSQILLLSSMVLGLPFGIDKGFSLFVIIGTVSLIAVTIFLTGFFTYAHTRICEKSNEATEDTNTN